MGRSETGRSETGRSETGRFEARRFEGGAETTPLRLTGIDRGAVLEGVPIHRDTVYSVADHARRGTVVICCAGSRSPRLVLDL